jgi:hypothetical protein
MVAQIDEKNAAMVADAVHPARNPDILADMLFSELAAGVGAVGRGQARRGRGVAGAVERG